MTQHHEANIARHGGVSLATRALALYKSGYFVKEIAIALFGEDDVYRRRQVHALIHAAQRAEALAG